MKDATEKPAIARLAARLRDAGAWPAPPNVPPFVAYGCAIVAPGIAWLVELALRPAILQAPFVLFFLAVAVTAWIGNARAAVLCMILSAILGDVFFLERRVGTAVLPTLLFVVVASLIVFLTTTVRRNHDRHAVTAQAARAAQQQLETILRHITEGISVQRRDGTVVFANDAAAQLSGYATGGELVGTPLSVVRARFEILDDAGQPVPYDRLPSRRALDGEPAPEAVVRIRDRRSGESRWRLLRATAVASDHGPPELVVNLVRDVTARKHAEDEQRFAAEAATTLASSLDAEETLRAVGRLAVPRLGDGCSVDVLAPDGSVKRLITAHADPQQAELERQPPDLQAQDGLSRVLRSGVGLLEDTVDDALEPGDADRRHGVRSRMIAPILGRGRTLGAITLTSAERGRYGEADLDLIVRLGAKAGLAIENARLYGDALDALRMRDDFIAVAGHELRTPLTALLLQVEGLQLFTKAREADATFSRMAARLDKAVAHARRLERLINELLDVSRIASGRLTLTREPVDLLELVREVVDRHEHEWSNGQTITAAGEAGLVGSWDRMRLDQVVTNLVANAMKYGAGQPVELVVERLGSGAALHIVDHGIGIAAADLKRIFERFERAVTERHSSGLGLGLWISREIVGALGGTIRVASEPGVLTTFTVELPLDAPGSP